MMKNFTITGFADEISSDFNEQIRVLQENEISHIEIRGIEGKNVSDFSLEEARRYKEILDKNRIRVSSIGSPIGKINIEDSFSEHLEKFKHTLQIATIFESPYIRMFSFFIDDSKNPDDFKNEVIRRWLLFLEAAKQYSNITLLHENEKGIYGDTPDRCLTLIKELNNSQIKLAFDPANFVQCDVEVYPRAFNLLKEHIGYLHIKDALFSSHKVTPAGLGDGKIEAVLSALVKQNYVGFASLEPHLSIFDGFLELEKENISIEGDSSEGEKLFTLASNSLKEIIVSKLGLEWR